MSHLATFGSQIAIARGCSRSLMSRKLSRAGVGRAKACPRDGGDKACPPIARVLSAFAKSFGGPRCLLAEALCAGGSPIARVLSAFAKSFGGPRCLPAEALCVGGSAGTLPPLLAL